MLYRKQTRNKKLKNTRKPVENKLSGERFERPERYAHPPKADRARARERERQRKTGILQCQRLSTHKMFISITAHIGKCFWRQSTESHTFPIVTLTSNNKSTGKLSSFSSHHSVWLWCLVLCVCVRLSFRLFWCLISWLCRRLTRGLPLFPSRTHSCTQRTIVSTRQSARVY